MPDDALRKRIQRAVGETLRDETWNYVRRKVLRGQSIGQAQIDIVAHAMQIARLQYGRKARRKRKIHRRPKGLVYAKVFQARYKRAIFWSWVDLGGGNPFTDAPIERKKTGAWWASITDTFNQYYGADCSPESLRRLYYRDRVREESDLAVDLGRFGEWSKNSPAQTEKKEPAE